MRSVDTLLEAPVAALRRGGSLGVLRRWNLALGGLHVAQAC
jgi:hypothetical protein